MEVENPVQPGKIRGDSMEEVIWLDPHFPQLCPDLILRDTPF